ncbi:MAG: amidase [Dehalococcoidia bacterium]
MSEPKATVGRVTVGRNSGRGVAVGVVVGVKVGVVVGVGLGATVDVGVAVGRTVGREVGVGIRVRVGVGLPRLTLLGRQLLMGGLSGGRGLAMVSSCQFDTEGCFVATDNDLAFTPAYQLRKLIAQKKLSPVELTENCLRRIDSLNPRLNAFLTVCADEALKDARRAEEAVLNGGELRLLHGIPTSIKDLLPTKGIRTTKGSLVYKDWVPDEDDLLVKRIRESGAIILGKTNTPEFGHGGGVTENRLGDYCRNPWNPEMVSGASSGGAGVSVAAGMNPIAHGTDGAGSIRVPASFCGIYGIMGTSGRVPRRNAGPISWNPVYFSQDGPLTRTVRDAALYLQVMAGPHPDAQTIGTIQEHPPDFTANLDKGVKGLRMAWSPDLGSIAIEPEVRRIVEGAAQVFQDLGASVELAPFQVDIGKLSSILGKLTGPIDFISYGHLLNDSAHLLMSYVREGIERGGTITAHEYAMALAELQQFRAYVDDFFTRYDLLLTPTLAVPPFPCGQRPKVIDGKEVEEMWAFYAPLFGFNMTGNPAASIPCGFTPDGLPIGMQIVGHKLDEVTVLRASAAFEEARPWAHVRPPIS